MMTIGKRKNYVKFKNFYGDIKLELKFVPKIEWYIVQNTYLAFTTRIIYLLCDKTYLKNILL